MRLPQLFNRPVVAGVVLKIPLSLPDYLNQSSFVKMSCYLYNQVVLVKQVKRINLSTKELVNQAFIETFHSVFLLPIGFNNKKPYVQY